jgi:shikimate kinase
VVVDKRRAAVFLVGFMGAGKTTIGRALGRLLGREFVDLDDRIVEADGRDIPRILRESGEPYFRDLEARLLADLRGRAALVVACGGGTYAHPACRAVIDGLGTAVWLQAPLAVMLARCGAGAGRPLLGSPEEARALYLSRLPAYRAAPVRVDVDGLTPEEAAERIAARL